MFVFNLCKSVIENFVSMRVFRCLNNFHPKSLRGAVRLSWISVFCATGATLLLLVSCGTMPVPDMPQAKIQPPKVGPVSISDNKASEDTALTSSQATVETPSIEAATRPQKSQTKSDKVESDAINKTPTQNIPAALPNLADKLSPDNTQEAEGVTQLAAVADKSRDIQIHEPAVTTIFPKNNVDVPQFPIMTAYQRVQNAIAFLNQGNEYQARKELADALVIEPSNRAARKLMRQLNQSAGEGFPLEPYFEYRLRPNETLVSVAKKFLDDPLDFYNLAKYNNIKIPADVPAGKILKIPGTKDTASATSDAADLLEPREKAQEQIDSAAKIKFERAKVYYSEQRYQEAIDLLAQTMHDTQFSEMEPARELLAANYRDYADSLIKSGSLSAAQRLLEASVSALPDNNALLTKLLAVKNDNEAERLYQLGQNEIKLGKDDLALKTLSKAVQLNPHLSQAKKQIADLKLSVVESYHKKAMVLYRKQELSQAIQIWDEILQIDPDFELAKQYKAKALELKRRIEQL